MIKPKFVSNRHLRQFGIVICCVFAASSAVWAQTAEVPAEATDSTAEVPAPAVERIVCDGLPYTDRGVSMAPLRPLSDFLKATTTYQDGLVTIVKNFDGGAVRTVTLRLGGKSAQIWDGAAPRTVSLARPAESRLGVIFMPAKFLVEILGGQMTVDALGVPRRVQDGTRQGEFAVNGEQKYAGSDAVRVTLTNRVGKAMSLRLTGPQKLRVEIGQGGTVYLQIKPGVYYFQANSSGMQTINGARRFLAGRKTTWAWGRK